MGGKEFYEKTEEFAKKIINLAAEEGLTVRELCKAADTAKGIADYSMVDKHSTERVDYPSRYIVEQSEELFIPTDSNGTKYPVGGISIPRPSDIHEHNQ